MARELLDAFGAELKGLQRAEKRDINALSMIAEDNKQYAAGLVTTIETHLLNVCYLGPFCIVEAPWKPCLDILLLPPVPSPSEATRALPP